MTHQQPAEHSTTIYIIDMNVMCIWRRIAVSEFNYIELSRSALQYVMPCEAVWCCLKCKFDFTWPGFKLRIHKGMWYVLSCLYGDSGFPLKKYATMTICLMSNSWWNENQCALEVPLNKTNFPFLFHWWSHTSSHFEWMEFFTLIESGHDYN